jgi:ligand-binding sensor domain-containing protein
MRCNPFCLLLITSLALSVACTRLEPIQAESTPTPVISQATLPSETPMPAPIRAASSQPTTAEISSPIDNAWMSLGPEGRTISALVIDPKIPNTLYAGSWGDGVFKSTNGGATWSAINTDLPNHYVTALAIGPALGGTSYVGTLGGVFKMFNSAEGGAIWSAVNTGLTNTHVLVLAIDPAIPGTLYVGTSDGVFKSTDGGAAWINTGLKNTGVYALLINPASPDTLYAGTSIGVFKSTNGSATWKVVNSETAFNVLAITPTIPDTLYMGTWHGVLKSTDSGVTWEEAGLMDSDISALVIDSATPDTFYAGTEMDGVFKSTDGGRTWGALNKTGLLDGQIQALAIDPAAPDTLYVVANHGVFVLRQNENLQNTKADTVTPIPTANPVVSPQPTDCTQGWTRLKLDSFANVTGAKTDTPNRVRSGPSSIAEIISQIYPGDIVKVVEGPICADKLVFWRVENKTIPGGSGWTAEGDLQEYWLVPFHP